jgi:hypothetical protein
MIDQAAGQRVGISCPKTSSTSTTLSNFGSSFFTSLVHIFPEFFDHRLHPSGRTMGPLETRLDR